MYPEYITFTKPFIRIATSRNIHTLDSNFSFVCLNSVRSFSTFSRRLRNVSSSSCNRNGIKITNLTACYNFLFYFVNRNYDIHKLTSLDLSISSVRCTLSIGVILMRSLHQGHPRTPMNFRTFFCMQRMAMSWVYNRINIAYN